MGQKKLHYSQTTGESLRDKATVDRYNTCTLALVREILTLRLTAPRTKLFPVHFYIFSKTSLFFFFQVPVYGEGVYASVAISLPRDASVTPWGQPVTGQHGQVLMRCAWAFFFFKKMKTPLAWFGRPTQPLPYFCSRFQQEPRTSRLALALLLGLTA